MMGCHGKATKIVHIGDLRRSQIEAIIQNDISSSIFGVRRSSLEQIKVQIEENSKKNLFSRSHSFKWICLCHKSALKSHNLHLGLWRKIRAPLAVPCKAFSSPVISGRFDNVISYVKQFSPLILGGVKFRVDGLTRQDWAHSLVLFP